MSRAAVALFMFTILAKCAGEPVGGASTDSYRRIANALEASQAADAPWVAAAFSRFGERAGERPTSEAFRTALDRAFASPPSDRAVEVAYLRLCEASAACDVRVAADRVARVDPGNGIALLPALDEAVQSGDDARIDRALATMAEAEYWNVYFNDVTIRFARALVAAAPFMDRAEGRGFAKLDRAYGNSVGLAAGFLLPPLGSLSRACRNPSPERRAACVRVMTSMQASSDTLLTSGFGAAMLLRLSSRGSPEHAVAIAARRLHEWRLDALQNVDPVAALRESQDLASRLPREQDVVVEIMKRHAIPLDPPAEWRPDIGVGDASGPG